MNTFNFTINDENANLPVRNKSNLTTRGLAPTITKQMISNAQPLSTRAPLSNISNMQPQSLPQQPLVTKNQVQQRLPASNRMVISPEKSEIKAPTFFQQSSAAPQVTFAQNYRAEQRNKALLISPGIDKNDRHDPQLVADLAAEITEHYRNVETKYMASHNYMEKQTDISHTMRTILVDWLVDVHHKFQFQTETLYLCVNIIDRFLSRKSVARNKLQLVGITAMLIAAKYEEIYVPEVKEFAHLSADAYVKDEVLRMERVILSTLDFNVTVTTVFPFLRRYLKCGTCNAQTQFISYYLSELAIMEYDSLKYTPSTLACAAIYLANKMDAISEGKEHEGWTQTLEYYTEKSATDLRECVDFLWGCAKRVMTSKLNAVRKKYCSERRGEVAKVVAQVVKTVSFKL
jgi:hypothetical protein